ncbi:putative phage abortive infection protein [Lysinibacillus sp. NPDC047702]|uniref:putative phage abortive infection protein n=1 Tax=unclassified Lysinibacillus TaxID=2636778 RepID=UPI003D046B97
MNKNEIEKLEKLTVENREIPGYKKVENYFMIIGGVFSSVAIATPFSIIYFNNYKYNLDKFAELGTVGDFFGGTTVGLLSLASLLFVTAAMIMQKKELELQRTEITKTREEFKISNKQSRRALFENKFFNMIDIHYKIISELNIGDKSERDVLAQLEVYFRDNLYYPLALMYESSFDLIIIRMWEKKFIKERPLDFYYALKYFYLKEFEESEELKELFHSALQDINEGENFSTSLHLIYSKTIKGKNVRWRDYFIDYSFMKSVGYSFEEMEKLEKEFLEFIEEKSKKLDEIYTLAFLKLKNKISHYYRNFFHIISYIENFDFDEGSDQNQKIREEYLTILTSQLTPIEFKLLSDYALYYNGGNESIETLERIGFLEEGKYKIDKNLFNLMI